MKPKLANASIIFVILFFSINGIAQKTKVQSIKKIPKSAQAKKKQNESNKCIFSDKEIDLNIEQLPSSYIGNNPQIITEEVIKKGKFINGEFETTAQFQTRIENEKKKKITGDLSYNSFFALSDSDSSPFNYDADNQRLNVNVSVGSIQYLKLSCEPAFKNIINSLMYEKGRFTAYYSFKQSFDFDIESAKVLKANLRTLFIYKLGEFEGGNNIFPSIWIDTIYQQSVRLIGLTTERDKAQIQFNFARREAVRYEELLEKGIVSKIEFDEVIKNRNDAESNLKALETKLQKAQTQIYLYKNETTEVPKDEKPAIIGLLKEIWIYDISTGKILIKNKLPSNEN